MLMLYTVLLIATWLHVNIIHRKKSISCMGYCCNLSPSNQSFILAPVQFKGVVAKQQREEYFTCIICLDFVVDKLEDQKISELPLHWPLKKRQSSTPA